MKSASPWPDIGRRGVVLLWLLVTVFLLLIIVLDPFAPWLANRLGLRNQDASTMIRVVAVALVPSMILLRIVLQRRRQEKDDEAPDDETGEVRRLDPAELFDALSTVARKYSPEALDFFRAVLLYPKLHIVRAVEEAEIKDQSLRLRVSLTMDAKSMRRSQNRGTAPHLVVPLIRAEKGTLLDGLDLEDVQGASVPSLSQKEVKALVALTLDAWFRTVYPDPSSARTGGVPTGARGRVWALMMSILLDLGPTPKSAINELRRAFKSPDARPDYPELAAELLTACEFFARSYVVAVEVPHPEGSLLILRYSKFMPLAQEDTLKHRLRLRLGLRPFQFPISISLPFLASSYHFRMTGTPGQYIHNHYLMDPITRQRVEAHSVDMGDGGPPYVRSRGRCGLPYAHLYVHHLEAKEAHDLTTVIEFSEIPPGALGAATLVAASTAVLIIGFALLGAGTANGLETDLPAVLLALPAVAASWLGQASNGESLLRTSLTTRLGTLGAGVIAFTSALLYVAQRTEHLREPAWDFSLLWGKVKFHDLSLYWLVLGLVALLLFVNLYRALWIRTRTYLKEAKRGSQLASARQSHNASSPRRHVNSTVGSGNE